MFAEMDNSNSNSAPSINEKKFLQKQLKEIKSLKYLNKDNSASLIIDESFLNEHFLCRICKDILHNPICCSECGENFCEECILKFTTTNKACINSCPWKNGILVKTHPAVMNFLDKLSFVCLNSCGNDKIPYFGLEKHLQSTCKLKRMICKNNLCNFTGNEEEVKKHLSDCDYSTVFCPICKTSFKRIEKHNCAEFFINKYNQVKESYSKMLNEYTNKFQFLEDLSEFINKQIENKNTKNEESKEHN
jgi:hypothetical protein